MLSPGITRDFVEDFLTVLIKHELVDDHVLRDFRIRMEYREMKASGISGKECRELLSEKYFTGIKNIEHIIYRKKEK